MSLRKQRVWVPKYLGLGEWEETPPPLLLEHPSGMRVELIDWMGDDLAIVDAARVSYGKSSKYEEWRIDPENFQFEKKISDYDHVFWSGSEESFHNWHQCLSAKDAGLVNFLMRERHGTPFEMVQLKFRVKAPIGVIWEWVRHRIASYNIMSTRYVEWDVDYYVPEAAEWRKAVGKQGNYNYETITDGSQLTIAQDYIEAMESAFSYYGVLLEKGLAKEVARNVLPMGAMTEMIWSVNLRSMFNFLSLRTDSRALQEIQIAARMVQDLTSLVVPETMQLWKRHNKVTP